MVVLLISILVIKKAFLVLLLWCMHITVVVQMANSHFQLENISRLVVRPQSR